MDDHNTALLREQALAAQEASRDLPVASGSRDRGDSNLQERGSRPNRPVGAARLFGGALGAARSSKNRQTEIEDRRDHRRERSPYRSQEASSNRSYGGRKRGDDDRSPGPSRRIEKSHRSERENSRERSSTLARRRSRSREARPDRERETDRRSTRRERSRSPSGLKDKSPSEGKRGSESKSRGDRFSLEKDEPECDGANAPPIQSKMDRYFEESYNPQLDLTGVLPIPSSGLVPDIGWDNMLAVLKEKGKKVRGFSLYPGSTRLFTNDLLCFSPVETSNVAGSFTVSSSRIIPSSPEICFPCKTQIRTQRQIEFEETGQEEASFSAPLSCLRGLLLRL